MNKIHLTATICTLIIFSACTTDFEVTAPWKDIPVVYGFLDPQDSAHYLRVEKAFLDPDGDARQIAEIADSLYYGDEVAVQLENLATGDVFTLEKVDGALEGFPREEGAFAESPNYLYKIDNSAINLEGGEELRLIINRGDDQDAVTAETKVLSPIVPVESSPPNELTLRYTRFARVSWNFGEEAQIFDVRMIINYRESDPDNPTQFNDKSITWILADEMLRESQSQTRQSINFLGEDFYRFIGAEIDDQVNLIRIFKDIDIIITGAGQEFVDFLEITRANSGITSSQVIPVYTNLSEGRGIFTSRTSTVRTGITLTQISLDLLKDGIHTQNLNFQ